MKKLTLILIIVLTCPAWAMTIITRPVEHNEKAWPESTMIPLGENTIMTICSFPYELLNMENVLRVKKYAKQGIGLWVTQTKGRDFLSDNGHHYETCRVWNQILQLYSVGIEPTHIYLDYEELRISDPAKGFTDEQKAFFVECVDDMKSSIDRLCMALFSKQVPFIWHASGCYRKGLDRYSTGKENLDIRSNVMFHPLLLANDEQALKKTVAMGVKVIPLVVINGGYNEKVPYKFDHQRHIGINGEIVEPTFTYCTGASYAYGQMMRLYEIDTVILYGGVPGGKNSPWWKHFVAFRDGWGR